MPFLVAAATDQTGRTITMLSAALVGVALGLTVLTLWYWRFTSPTRRATASGAVADTPSGAVADTPSGTLEREEPSEQPTIAEPPAAERVLESDVGAEPSPSEEGSAIGLDSEEWAVLTRAVMDEYLDS